VYKLIQRFLQKWFGEDELTTEFKNILIEISNATTLKELYKTRQDVTNFSNKAKKRGRSIDTKHTNFLIQKWNSRYRLWRSRG